jgi:hypothetical protein
MTQQIARVVAVVLGRLRCALGGHQWKRAKRTTDSGVGTRACRRCGELRFVILRAVSRTTAR